MEAAKQQHEQTKTFHRHQIVEGPEWAGLLQSYRPRTGPKINVPGFDMLGGLIPGDLILLAGRPGAGKSTLACQLSVEACFKGEAHIPTLVVSTEMTMQDWWLQKTKGDVSATYYAMVAWAERCSPPMVLHELKATIKSVARLGGRAR